MVCEKLAKIRSVYLTSYVQGSFDYGTVAVRGCKTQTVKVVNTGYLPLWYVL